MTPELYNLLDKIADDAVVMLNNDRTFRSHLLAADAPTRSEIAYYLNDRLTMHPDLPDDVNVPFANTEKFIAHQLNIADWKVRWNELDEELQDLRDAAENIDLFADDTDDI